MSTTLLGLYQIADACFYGFLIRESSSDSILDLLRCSLCNFELSVSHRWFCHVDDDNYVNVRTLVKLLSNYPHTQDMYIGKPSLDRPIEATERLGDNKMVGGCAYVMQLPESLYIAPFRSEKEKYSRLVLTKCLHALRKRERAPVSPSALCLFQRPVNFWFATGGAGFCVSRGLALKMSPWAR